ncbi:MAG: FMN-binding protein [Bacillota bacterium]|jgi:major membrane immunogen (membrane-anchored lipoprotein)|nr:FMN-binding protein [Bacillota bacterium]NLU55600.1 FMN-binding protein [Bacillota bacterium]HOA91442.1 FMN-binding protein [Bacillota bacterium]HOJ47125.1 FMN-binding protein [Bacillota bacterium]HOP54495.1 FMN-binding protein [Bacillota bacterium]
MKRNLLFVLVLTVVAVLSIGVAAKMIDGTYSLNGPTDDHGNYPVIKMVVKDGKIASVEYDEIIAAQGVPKSKDNYNWEPYFSAVEYLEKRAVEVNGDVSKIDAIAQATGSSVKFKDMLLAVQLQAVQLKDAIYPPVELEPDNRGYAPKLQITVSGGKISKVEYYEYNTQNGTPKEEGVYNWPAYFEAIKYFGETAVKENGNIMNIDAFAGATSTSDKFFALYRTLVNMILLVAKQ